MLSGRALETLAGMMNVIEEDAEWPKQMNVSMAAFIAKHEENA